MLTTYTGTTYPWQCDHMGHMNVQFYAAKFDEATWQLFGHIGLTPGYLRTTHRGMVALEQKTRYKKEVIAGDIIGIDSCILEVMPKRIRFLHVMKKSDTDEVVAETELTGVHIDTIERKSHTFDDDIKKAAESLVNGSEG